MFLSQTNLHLHTSCYCLLQNKKNAFKSCRDLEASWDQLEESKKVKTDKDVHKMEKTCRKLEESLVKADREYRDSNIKTEESRLAWESAMYRCCRVRQEVGVATYHYTIGLLLYPTWIIAYSQGTGFV